MRFKATFSVAAAMTVNDNTSQEATDMGSARVRGPLAGVTETESRDIYK